MVRVLLVEDEPGIAEALSEFLRMQGLTVAVAVSEAEGLRLAAASEFDCIVSDEAIAGGSGRVVIDAALTRRPRVRALLYSAHVSDAVRAWATRTGVDILDKPVRPARLLEWVRAAFREDAVVQRGAAACDALDRVLSAGCQVLNAESDDPPWILRIAGGASRTVVREQLEAAGYEVWPIERDGAALAVRPAPVRPTMHDRDPERAMLWASGEETP